MKINTHLIDQESESILREVNKPSFDLQVMSLDELYKKEFPDPEWLVEGLIPSHTRIAFSGQPGSYKTFVSQLLAIHISQGTPVFGHYPTKQSRVLIIDLENHPQLIQERMRLLGAPETKDLSFSTVSEFSLEEPEHVKAVIQQIREHEIKLVILDSLTRMHESKENDAGEMAKVTKTFKKIIDAGASVIFIHHDRKSDSEKQTPQSLRGSSEIRAAVDLQYGFKTTGDIITISQFKNRLQQEIDPFSLKKTQQENTLSFELLDQVPHEIQNHDDAIELAVHDILQDQPNLNYQNLLRAVCDGGFSRNKSAGVISKLRKMGVIRAVPSGKGNEKYYAWVIDHTDHSFPKVQERSERSKSFEEDIDQMTVEDAEEAPPF